MSRSARRVIRVIIGVGLTTVVAACSATQGDAQKAMDQWAEISVNRLAALQSH